MTYGCSMLAAEPGYVDTEGGEDHDEGIHLDASEAVVSLQRDLPSLATIFSQALRSGESTD